jgi:hypothetical protein
MERRVRERLEYECGVTTANLRRHGSLKVSDPVGVGTERFGAVGLPFECR